MLNIHKYYATIKDLYKSAYKIIYLQIFVVSSNILQASLLSKYAGAVNYGKIYSFNGLTSIVAALSCFGWPAIIMKTLAQKKSSTNSAQLLTNAIFDTVICAGLHIYILYLTNITPLNIYLYMLLAARTASLLAMGVMQGLHRAESYIIYINIIQPILVSLIIVCLYFLLPVEPVKIYALLSFFYVAIFITLLCKTQPAKPWPNFNLFQQLKRSRKENLLLYFSSSGNAMLIFADGFLIGHLLSYKSAGEYGVIMAWVSVITMCMPAINAIYAPKATALIENQQQEQAGQLYHKYRTIAIIWASIAIVILSLLALSNYIFIGQSFSSNFTFGFALLALGQFCNCWTGPITITLYINGYVKAATIPTALYSIIHCILMILAILAYGFLGAAFVSMLSIAGLNIFQYSYARKNGII